MRSNITFHVTVVSNLKIVGLNLESRTFLFSLFAKYKLKRNANEKL